jgi:hypothetical protein
MMCILYLIFFTGVYIYIYIYIYNSRRDVYDSVIIIDNIALCVREGFVTKLTIITHLPSVSDIYSGMG